MKCMNFTSKGTREILVAGCQEQMFKVDVEKGIITHTVCLFIKRPVFR
jgi:PAB-dependent poly(A)-specific ribonuclease subunit 2